MNPLSKSNSNGYYPINNENKPKKEMTETEMAALKGRLKKLDSNSKALYLGALGAIFLALLAYHSSPLVADIFIGEACAYTIAAVVIDQNRNSLAEENDIDIDDDAISYKLNDLSAEIQNVGRVIQGFFS